jgi:transposase
MWDQLKYQSIYLYRHAIDMRKGMDGLASLVQSEMQLNPRDNNLYLFLNRNHDKLKILLWERNGFWVLYKRLQQQKFHWPDWFENNELQLSQEQCLHLLQGFNLNGMRPHKTLFLQHNF